MYPKAFRRLLPFSTVTDSPLSAVAPAPAVLATRPRRAQVQLSQMQAGMQRPGSLAAVKANSSLAHTLSLAQLADEGFGLTAADGTPLAANKMMLVKALMSLKHDIEMSWQAKRDVINAIADNALAAFVLINIALKRWALVGGVEWSGVVVQVLRRQRLTLLGVLMERSLLVASSGCYPCLRTLPCAQTYHTPPPHRPLTYAAPSVPGAPSRHRRRLRSARLKKYAQRKDLNARMPGFNIAMGFGLHVGWAIEGAIGETRHLLLSGAISTAHGLFSASCAAYPSFPFIVIQPPPVAVRPHSSPFHPPNPSTPLLTPLLTPPPRVRIQDRRQLPQPQRKHGLSPGGRHQAVWGAHPVVRGLRGVPVATRALAGEGAETGGRRDQGKDRP